MYSPDFVKLAEAYGIPARRVEHRHDITPAVEWAQGINDGPVLIEFRVETHDIVYPMVPAGADLHEMIRRPLPSKNAV
jgi:acetolactate synthase-1/2/3 large subunit